MEGKGRIPHCFLNRICCIPAALLFFLIAFMTAHGCVHEEMECSRKEEFTIRIDGEEFMTKSVDPDENKITDISLMIFDEYGTLEDSRWISSQDIGKALREGLVFRMIPQKHYRIFGCVNFGYQVKASSVEELGKTRYYMTHPEDYRQGIPMCIEHNNIVFQRGCGEAVLHLKRLMAKISISVDRSRLSDNISMNVTGIRIGNCPKVVKVFGSSSVTENGECFTSGFSREESEIDLLNKSDTKGKSGEISLYMLENMQGTYDGNPFDTQDPRFKTCSYVELDLEYNSPDKASWSKPLKYRFYLGENSKDLNMERNCHYHITVIPEDDGLNGSGWKVDKSGICTFAKEIILSKSRIEFEYEGEISQIEADVLPKDATFKDVCWSSSDPKVADVSDAGVVTAKGNGKCRILCSAYDGAGAKAECEVNCNFTPPFLTIHPGTYITGDIGDQVHIWCDFFPPNAAFDVGLEELEFDKERGIYDYTVDTDGHGVTLTLLKPGRGIIYMSAGYPINDSKMAVIEINMP